jgi:2,5-furandicarboxylate decarboxylase 1
MDFRNFVDQLDSDDELLWIRKPVDPEYELGTLLRQAEQRGKAIWFEKVSGSYFPAVGGVMSDPDRHALSIGRSPTQLAQPGAWGDLVRAARDNPLPAVVRASGPAAAVIRKGADIDINRLPVPLFFSGDTHRFITAGIGIVMDPETGVQNAGFYRAPVLDGQRIAVNGGMSSQLNKIYVETAKQGRRLQVAYVIGAPPALLITAGCRIGRAEADLDIAGALQGSPLELMRCQTSDLLVPAGAEFIIEAEVDFKDYVEHTMGEFPDQYGTSRAPVAHITAITHRDDAVMHTIMAGMNREHNSLGVYMFIELRAALLTHLRERFSCLRDIHVDFTPPRTGNRSQVTVSIDRNTGQQPADIIAAVFEFAYEGFPMERILQRVVIVDNDIDIRNHSDVEWAIAMRANSKARMGLCEIPGRNGGTTVRFGIDATVDKGDLQAKRRPEIPGADRYPLERYL